MRRRPPAGAPRVATRGCCDVTCRSTGCRLTYAPICRSIHWPASARNSSSSRRVRSEARGRHPFASFRARPCPTGRPTHQNFVNANGVSSRPLRRRRRDRPCPGSSAPYLVVLRLPDIDMSIATNLNGRLRNTLLPLSHGLLALFEAVINSIHGIEDAGIAAETGRIHVTIERAGPGLFDADDEHRGGGHPLPDITGFTVTDNGIGFNDENFDAFMTLDTERKVARGGRGIGRLLWLKAFDHVDVISTFDADGTLRQRSFMFNRTARSEERRVGK